MNIKNLFVFIFVALTFFQSCSTDEEIIPSPQPFPTNNIIVTNNITEDTEWCNEIYVLNGKIVVEEGATLTICPGTIIKGSGGTGVNASSLLIARGAKIMAEGNANAPIIFTSIADEISLEDVDNGNFASPNLSPDFNGLWGGLIVLGNAPISASNAEGDVSEVQIEGIPTSDINGLYGGNDIEDNSGVLSYISIRHGGTNIGEGNEINGLTLGGVGSGTVINNIEVVGNQDDGIEWFGGSVDVTNVVVWNAGDDAIDTDQSWSGTLNNFVVITPSGSCFELDGPEGSFDAGKHTITNGTVISITDYRVIGGSLIDVDEETNVHLSNIHFIGPFSVNNSYLTITDDEINNTTFNNVTFDISEENLPLLMEQGGEVPSGIFSNNQIQTNISGFEWTWTYIKGNLDF